MPFCGSVVETVAVHELLQGQESRQPPLSGLQVIDGLSEVRDALRLASERFITFKDIRPDRHRRVLEPLQEVLRFLHEGGTGTQANSAILLLHDSSQTMKMP